MLPLYGKEEGYVTGKSTGLLVNGNILRQQRTRDGLNGNWSTLSKSFEFDILVRSKK